MPILIQNTNFYDNFGGGPFNVYRTNAGDRSNLTINLWTGIRVSSLNNSVTLDPSLNQVTSTSQSWLDEGFRFGDTVFCTIRTSGGTIVQTWSSVINYVDDFMIDLTTIPFWPDTTAGEWISFEVPSKAGRGDLELLFNHVKNSQAGNEFSLIDGEVTRILFSNTNSIPVGGFQIGVITGNQSGQYLISAQISRNAPPGNNQVSFTISLDFSNSGIYDETLFNTSECLKPYLKMKWSRDPGEVSNVYEKVINDSANTGWFNQPYNIDPVNAVLVQGITEIDYCTPSSHTVIVDGPLTNIGIGASYVPLDDTYFKNKPLSQKDLGLFIPTSSVGIPLLISGQNATGAGYTITIDNVASVGTVTTIDLTITPNAAFQTFMDGREVGDRLFYVWVKCGNINFLVYNDQLTCEPPVGAPLEIEGEKAYFDHSENITEAVDPVDMIEFNVEDDFAYYGYFLLEKGKIYDVFTAKIEAFNSVSGDDFTLLELAFNFIGVQISGDGRYLLNETLSVINTLPTTSVKREAHLYLNPAADTPTHYGVAIYFPALLRWEYWLPQTNANVDFYPNQNKFWQQYDVTGNWGVQLELNLQENGLSHIYTKPIKIKPYDSEPLIEQTIELYIDSTNQNVGIVTEGLLMRVVATHTLINGDAWNPLGIWGMITVEPKESAPRKICSTVVPYDNDTNNPLTPLSGLLMPITFPAPNIARMECYFNPDLINLTNGCKFTTKVKGCLTEIPLSNEKITTGNVQKITTDGQLKLTS